jgi:hypothetical protein
VSLPLFFEPNQGQTAAPVKFLAHGSGYGLFLTADEAVLEVQHVEAQNPEAQPAVRRASRFSAHFEFSDSHADRWSQCFGSGFRGFAAAGKKQLLYWQRCFEMAARTFRSLRGWNTKRFIRASIWFITAIRGELEYDFRVAPGADPSQIALSFDGASARIDSGDSGDLILSTGQGRFVSTRLGFIRKPIWGSRRREMSSVECGEVGQGKLSATGRQ